ncbi:hypothetical protein V6N13_020902 [Hibiscus sabdariffa]
MSKPILTVNGFGVGEDGSGPSECDNKKSVKAKVVDECDFTIGCDDVHGYQPHAITSLLPLMLSGKPWECQKFSNCDLALGSVLIQWIRQYGDNFLH